MNMKKMKKFFTLSRRAEGFTLVELIVVIAILAILGGVAVPAYSGYVKKANMQADMTLISEIEHALELAGYSGTFNDENAGSLILSATQGVKNVEEGSALEKALVATFGTNYADTLKLKYAEWGNNGLALGLSGEKAQAVKNSSYYAVADQLMGHVEKMTDAAYYIINGANGENNRKEIAQMFDQGTLDSMAVQYGYDSFEKVPDEDLPNFLVLTIAGDVTTKTNNDQHTISQATNIIYDFAKYNAYASQNADFKIHYDTFVEKLNQTEDIAQIALAYDDLQDAANADPGYDDYVAAQGQTDVKAFEAMLSGLTGSAAMNQEDLAANISKQDFFTAGMGNDLFNTYLDAVDAAAGLSNEDADAIAKLILPENAGGVAIYYSLNAGKLSIGNTLPISGK